MQAPGDPDHRTEKERRHRKPSNLLFVKRPRAIKVERHQAARRTIIRRQETRVLKNQPECDLSIFVTEQAWMVGNVEKFSKMMFLRQFRQSILWPDLFDQFGQLRRIRISQITLELLGHGKASS